MRASRIGLILFVGCASLLGAQERSAADSVFAAALDGVRQELWGAPPANPLYPRDGRDLPTDAIVVARRTIGGAPTQYRAFVDANFGAVIAEELVESYGDSGPEDRAIERETADGFAVLPLGEFESGEFNYDWQRLNEKYPNVRFVVRVSWPAVDRLGTYGVVRYELIGRDRPSTVPAQRPWQHASFVKWEKQANGSWKRTIARIGNLWN